MAKRTRMIDDCDISVLLGSNGAINESVCRLFCPRCHSASVHRRARDNRDGQMVYKCDSCHHTTKYPLFQEMRCGRNREHPDVVARIVTAKQMRRNGVTLREIGSALGVSRQRVHQILKSDVEVL